MFLKIFEVKKEAMQLQDLYSALPIVLNVCSELVSREVRSIRLFVLFVSVKFGVQKNAEVQSVARTTVLERKGNA